MAGIFPSVGKTTSPHSLHFTTIRFRDWFKLSFLTEAADRQVSLTCLNVSASTWQLHRRVRCLHGSHASLKGASVMATLKCRDKTKSMSLPLQCQSFLILQPHNKREPWAAMELKHTVRLEHLLSTYLITIHLARMCGVLSISYHLIPV